MVNLGCPRTATQTTEGGEHVGQRHRWPVPARGHAHTHARLRGARTLLLLHGKRRHPARLSLRLTGHVG